MKKKFTGDLRWIDTGYLVDKENLNRVDSFFLGLGVIFNDLKSLLLFEKLLLETYEKPSDKEVTDHAGNYSGTLVYIQKMMAGAISEFFVFLKKNAEIYADGEFRQIIEQLPQEERQFWNSMVAAAHGKLDSVSALLRTIVHVRSNIAFHYDHSGKVLRAAYISRFFGNYQDERSERAYYSIGNSVEETRFYFAEAAAEESLYIAAGKKPKDDSDGNIIIQTYKQQIRDTIDAMVPTISKLVKLFIQSRRNRAH